jgi:hypothetical protein
VFDHSAYSARGAVRLIRQATADVCDWSPGGDTLTTHVARVFAGLRARSNDADCFARSPFERALKAFLASHLFASWAVYRPQGLIAAVESAEHALALAGDTFEDERTFIETVRAADLRLRHHAVYHGNQAEPEEPCRTRRNPGRTPRDLAEP